ncbi:hypothetical protein [Sphingobacterium sp. CZ-2]|uniref:hypothetical protein n=1 Tax=Sphingobacterium sp. CZ-2 TaxID=2557994 RepID=UPI00107012FA|nr:hypothetical protein [Sphingobacterium sp. CZ-2]QBR13548.1 hypothetical protein E3D81_15730 [Sphingobacterium sp. CZ-2]
MEKYPEQTELDQLQLLARSKRKYSDGEELIISSLEKWPELLKKELDRYRNASWFLMNNKKIP